MTCVLIDADLIAFRCAAASEEAFQSFVPLSRVQHLFEQILQETHATEWQSYLSGHGNFRKEIYPLYKAKRTKPTPKWLASCREFLVDEWKSIIFNGAEADDALGIASTRTPNAIVISIDKDLLQLPARHYNFVKKEFQQISKARALRNFYEQLLIGDATDGVKGCTGIGKAKAPRILEGCETEEEMFDCVRGCYNNDAEMSLNGRLLWIWREYGGIWPKALNLEKNIEQEQEAL